MSRQRIIVSLAGLVMVMAAGCVQLPYQSSTPSVKVSSLRAPESDSKQKMTAPILGAEVARFADELTSMVAQAADSFAKEVDTPQGRAVALTWKTTAANNAMIIGSGANPAANLLDMVVVVTLGRMTIEEYWEPLYGKPAEPMLQVCRKLEEEIWQMAARVLTPPQQEELRELIRAWREKNPDQLFIGARFRDFAEIASKGGATSRKTGSVFSLLWLDPLAGMDPATREMEQTRYVADRALFVMQRMPVLLRLQSELLVYQSLVAPEVQQVISNSTRFTESVQQLTAAVAKFPEQLSRERELIMKESAAQLPQWQALLTQLQATFEAGNQMATSVDTSVKSIQTMVGTFASLPANTNAVDRKPFDVTEYGAAAAQVGAAAQQLNTLAASIEKTTPQLNAVVDRTGLQGKELVDYTFRRALWFLAAALVGLVVALLVYRWLAVRMVSKTKPDGPQ